MSLIKSKPGLDQDEFSGVYGTPFLVLKSILWHVSSATNGNFDNPNKEITLFLKYVSVSN